MSLDRPSLPQLQQQALSDITARVDGATPTLRRSLLGPIGVALAGALNGLYGYVLKIAAQCNPATATERFLELWASLWGLTRKQPSIAVGIVIVTGIDGTTIPEGTELQSLLGATYTTDADAMIVAGTASIAITATLPGSDGNAPADTPMTFVSPVSGVDADAVSDGDGLGGGADLESDDGLRSRLFQRVQNPPHGGNKADYEAWARSVPGITRAWVFPLYAGVGTVRVYVADDAYSGATLAAPAEVTAVQAYIDSVKPVGVVKPDASNGFLAVAPTATAVNVSLTISPDSADNRASVQATLAELFFRRAEPEGTIKLHWIDRAILDSGTVDDYTLTAPVADTTAAASHILTLGTVTWL